jgi:hypothetical protein
MKLKKHSKRPRIVKLFSDVYGYTIVFIIGARPTKKELAVVAKRHDLMDSRGQPPDVPNGLGATWNRGHASLVWIPAIKTTGCAIAILMHEMIHVTTHLAIVTGQPINHDTDEMHAYFAGWTVRKLLKKYFK